MLTFNFQKFPTQETERLLLRNHDLADAHELFKMRTNEDVMQYIDRPRPKAVAEVEEQLRSFNSGYNNANLLVWAISLKENPGKLIGCIGFYRTDFANHRAEIGYMLHPDYWRKGLISEALHQIVTFGFKEMDLHTISANINPANDASRQILVKHGFVQEAYFKENYYFQGKFLDSEIYGIRNPSH